MTKPLNAVIDALIEEVSLSEADPGDVIGSYRQALLDANGLDVERLRQALHYADPRRYAECYHGLTVSDCGIDAEDIAREYAAIGEPSE